MSMLEIVCTRCGAKSFVVVDGTAKVRASEQVELAATDSQQPQPESTAIDNGTKGECSN